MNRTIPRTTLTNASNRRNADAIMKLPLPEWTGLADLRRTLGKFAGAEMIGAVRLLEHEGKVETRGGWDDPKGGTFEVRKKQ